MNLCSISQVLFLTLLFLIAIYKPVGAARINRKQNELSTSPPNKELIKKLLKRGRNTNPIFRPNQPKISASRKHAKEQYLKNSGLVSTDPRFKDDGPWEEQTTESSNTDTSEAHQSQSCANDSALSPSADRDEQSSSSEIVGSSAASSSDSSPTYASLASNSPHSEEKDWERAIGSNLQAFDRKRGRWRI